MPHIPRATEPEWRAATERIADEVIARDKPDDARCWPKAGHVTGDVYCGRHGRAAGWPCRTSRAALDGIKP